MILILLACLFQIFEAFAQVQRNNTYSIQQVTAGHPYSIPVYIDEQGRVSYLSAGNDSALIFKPTFMLSLSRVHINYVRPTSFEIFRFSPINNNKKWIEIKRDRMEFGLGFSTLLGAGSLGLIPYKGSMHAFIHHKDSSDDLSPSLAMPEELSSTKDWSLGDTGVYQTYGGIMLSAGLSLGTRVIGGSITIHNRFIIEMKKKSENFIQVRVMEEDLKLREVDVGPVVTRVSMGKLKAKRLFIEFNLNLEEELHHHLYSVMLKGDFQEIQNKLPSQLQKMSWTGEDKNFSLGIPNVYRKTNTIGSYEIQEEGKDFVLQSKGARLRGVLAPVRSYDNYAIKTGEGLSLTWSSEMKKMNFKMLEKRFFLPGRVLGVRGFERTISKELLEGAVITQMGLYFTQSEIENLKKIDLNSLKNNFKVRCEKFFLPCRNLKKHEKIISQFSDIMKRSWSKMRGDLGILFLNEPALISAVAATAGLKKDVYIKFLSEKFQSLEGTSPLPI